MAAPPLAHETPTQEDTNMAPTTRNARAEAAAVAGGGVEVRVLEPSPPAVDDGDWYADDPTALGDADPDKVVTPTSAGDVTWFDLAAQDSAVADYAAGHGLVTTSLAPVPTGFAEARADLNRLGFYVLSPARREATGKIALRYTAGGFGTPFFGDDIQIRVEGTDLVRQQGDTVTYSPMTTLAAAAKLVGVTLDPASGDDVDVPSLDDPDRALAVNADHIAFIAQWFGFATAALEELRLAGGPDDDVTRVQLWAEHFDPGVELGNSDTATRATYGGSPGDSGHPEPYLYVAAWGEVDRNDPYWNDDAFSGASISYADLRAADDPTTAAIQFLRTGFDKLTGR